MFTDIRAAVTTVKLEDYKWDGHIIFEVFVGQMFACFIW